MGYLLIARGKTHLLVNIIFFVWLALYPPDTPAKIQSRIERMDALIAEGPQVNLKRSVKRLQSDHWGRP